MNNLTPEQQQHLDTFKSITGLDDDESVDKIIKLLSINDFNLNNSVSTYFESGFESLGNDNRPSVSYSSAINIHDDEQELHHRSSNRHGSTSTHEIVNLQNQLFMDSLLPKLPKAPLISNGWQLEVGIHTSIIHERERELAKEKQMGSDTDSTLEKTESITDSIELKKSTNPLNAIWIILLILPKSILHVIVTTFKFLFGIGNTESNKMSHTFNYEKFHPDWKYFTNDTISQHFHISESNFNQLHSKCQKEYHWLMVILSNDSYESNHFVDQLIQNPDFHKLFNKNNGEFKETEIYINNVERSPESFEIGHSYKARKLPYLLLIGNVSASHEVMPSMSILYKSNLSKPFITDEELPNTIEKILKNFKKFLDKFDPQLVSARFDKQEMEFSRMIRQQQEEAYNESLIKDQQKKIEKQQFEKLQNEIEYLTRYKQFNLLNAMKNNIKGQFINDNGIRIALKFPDSKRIIEKFDRSMSIIEFYFYVEIGLFIQDLLQEQQCTIDEITNIIDELIDNLNMTDTEILSVDDYYEKFTFNFDIIQPYPKKIIQPSKLSIEEVNEFKGANFIVEYKDED